MECSCPYFDGFPSRVFIPNFKITGNVFEINSKAGQDTTLRLSDDDFSHPLSALYSLAPANTFFALQPRNSTQGGARIAALSNNSSNAALEFAGVIGATTVSTAVVQFSASKYDGVSNAASLADTEKAFAFTSGANQLFTVFGNNSLSIGSGTQGATLDVTQKSTTSGTPKAFKVTGAAWTGGTASTEIVDADFAFNQTKTFATGALSKQRNVLFRAPTYAFAGASNMTDAATVAITGAPVQGTNNTLAKTHALLIEAGAVGSATASYGITVNAQTGATTNYCAAFLGGRVGIGTSTPSYPLTITSAPVGGTVLGIVPSSVSPSDFLYFLNAGTVAGSVEVMRNQGACSTGLALTIINTDSSNGTANAQYEARTNGANSGDAQFLYTIAGQTNWIHGVDNSDSDKFKISAGATLGTSDAFIINKSGDVQVNPLGKLAFFSATPATQQTGGVSTAGASYTSTEQNMIQKAYDALRTYGLLT